MKRLICTLIILGIGLAAYAKDPPKQITLDLFNSGLKLVFDTEKGLWLDNTKDTNTFVTPIGPVETNIFDFLKTQKRENIAGIDLKKEKIGPNDLVIAGKGTNTTVYDSVVIKDGLKNLDVEEIKKQPGVSIDNGFLLIDPRQMDEAVVILKKSSIAMGDVPGTVIIVNAPVGGDVNISSINQNGTGNSSGAPQENGAGTKSVNGGSFKDLGQGYYEVSGYGRSVILWIPLKAKYFTMVFQSQGEVKAGTSSYYFHENTTRSQFLRGFWDGITEAKKQNKRVLVAFDADNSWVNTPPIQIGDSVSTTEALRPGPYWHPRDGREEYASEVSLE
jgi:hypothetical protein